jgi:hypothetical protein
MANEYDALMKNHTWDLVPLPKGKNWLVANGFIKPSMMQMENLRSIKLILLLKDSPKKRALTIQRCLLQLLIWTQFQMILSIVASLNWEVHQMDVKSAFLHGDLQEELYMQQPSGFVQNGLVPLVCKLKKSLYGLKQAPHAWYEKIHNFFISCGFTSLRG